MDERFLQIQRELMLAQARERHEDMEWMLYLRRRINELYDRSKDTFFKDLKDLHKFQYWWYRIHLLTTLLAVAEKTYGIKEVKNVEEAIRVKSLQGLSILEVGFGGEVLSEDRPHYLEIAQLGAKIFGLEPRERSVRMAKERCEREKSKITGPNGEILLDPSQMREGRMEDLPEIFPDQRFDMVCSSTVFAGNPLAGTPEHIFDEDYIDIKVRKWMEKIAVVLKPGGLAVHTNMGDAYFPKPEVIEMLGYRILALNRQIEEPDTGDAVGGADYYSVFMKK